MVCLHLCIYHQLSLQLVRIRSAKGALRVECQPTDDVHVLYVKVRSLMDDDGKRTDLNMNSCGARAGHGRTTVLN